LFFDCLRIHVEAAHPEQDWALLTDRLYRRYLRLEDLDQASALMKQVQSIFAAVPTASGIAWDPDLVGNREKTFLNPKLPTLADLFEKYFEHFTYCVQSSRLNYEAFKNYPNYSYEPVRIVIADLPGLARDQNKPLAEYDTLEGKPFWLR
jgi:hypothetical protein